MSIYLQHFALKREPFSIVPDPDFLYPSQKHRQAVAHLKYGLDREGGFILLTGEVGTGKTTLTRTMLLRIPAHVRVAYVLNSKLNPLLLTKNIPIKAVSRMIAIVFKIPIFDPTVINIIICLQIMT